jgi:hypothetical protein
MRPVAHNFRAVASAPVFTVPVSDLVAMLDRDQATKFAVVSKFVGPHYVTTAFDIEEHRLIRAAHDTGMHVFWKGLGRRRSNVQVLEKSQTYYPA